MYEENPQHIIPQKGKKVFYPGRLLLIIGSISIYSMAIPLVILDIFIVQYQYIYFTLTKIPTIKRSDYVIMDRSKLNGLNFGQKLNCIYCEYANGIIEYAKAVVNQTEVYSCAIKHNRSAQGQEHQKDFYEYDKFLK